MLTDVSTDGLNGARRGAVSFDGHHLYVAAEGDNGVAVYERDEDTGTLTLLEVERDAATLDGTSAVVVSPDGKHVYATSRDDDSVVYFTRDDNPLSATFGELTRDGAVTSTDLDGAIDLGDRAGRAARLRGRGTTAKKVVVLSRDSSTGVLTSASIVSDAVARRSTASPRCGDSGRPPRGGGRRRTRTRCCCSTGIPVTGALTIADVETSATNLDGAGGLAISPDGGNRLRDRLRGRLARGVHRKPDTDTLEFRDLEVDGVGERGGYGPAAPRGGEPRRRARCYVAGEGADDAVVIFRASWAAPTRARSPGARPRSSPDPYGLAMSPAGEHLLRAVEERQHPDPVRRERRSRLRRRQRNDARRERSTCRRTRSWCSPRPRSSRSTPAATSVNTATVTAPAGGRRSTATRPGRPIRSAPTRRRARPTTAARTATRSSCSPTW